MRYPAALLLIGVFFLATSFVAAPTKQTSALTFGLLFCAGGIFAGFRNRARAKAFIETLDEVQIVSGLGPEMQIVAFGRIVGKVARDTAFIGAVRLESFAPEFIARYKDDPTVLQTSLGRYLPLRLITDRGEDVIIGRLESDELKGHLTRVGTPRLLGTVSSSSVLVADTEQSQKELESYWSTALACDVK